MNHDAPKNGSERGHDERLADYLGDELAPADRAAFEASLAADPALAIEVAELRDALAAMRSLDDLSSVPFPAQPQASRRARPGGHGNATGGVSHSWLGGLLRYAAVILFAFTAGYWAKSPAAPTATVTPMTDTQTRDRKAAPAFEQRFAEAYGQAPADSELARSLIALARATR